MTLFPRPLFSAVFTLFGTEIHNNKFQPESSVSSSPFKGGCDVDPRKKQTPKVQFLKGDKSPAAQKQHGHYPVFKNNTEG